jgi:hypothetical protein
MEGKCNVTAGKSYSLPQKKRLRKKTEPEVGKFDKFVICRTITFMSVKVNVQH